MDDAETRYEKLMSRLSANPEQSARMRGLRDSNVRINVQLGEGSHLQPGFSPNTQNPWMDEALRSLPASVRTRLSNVEGRVLEWINASPENARRFASDPLAALRQAVPNLDNATVETLRSLRGRHSHVPGDAGIRVRGVALKAKRNPRP